jgi:hypothetical protein
MDAIAELIAQKNYLKEIIEGHKNRERVLLEQVARLIKENEELKNFVLRIESAP